MKKTLSVLLAVMLVLGAMSAAVFAAPPNWIVKDFTYEFTATWNATTGAVTTSTPMDTDLGEIFRVELKDSGVDLVIDNALQPEYRKTMKKNTVTKYHYTTSSHDDTDTTYDYWWREEYRRRDVVITSINCDITGAATDDLTDWTNNIKLGPWHDLFKIDPENKVAFTAPGPMPSAASGAANYADTDSVSGTADGSLGINDKLTTNTTLSAKTSTLELLRYKDATAKKLYPKTGDYTVRFTISYTMDPTGSNQFANDTAKATADTTGTPGSVTDGWGSPAITASSVSDEGGAWGTYFNTYLNTTGTTGTHKVTVWTAEETKQNLVGAPSGVYDENGKRLNNNSGANYTGEVSSVGNIYLDQVLPGQEIYIRLDNLPGMKENPSMFFGDSYTDAGARFALGDDLANDDYFKITSKKIKSTSNTYKGNDGNPLFKSVEQVSGKIIDKDGTDRGNYLKVVFNDSFAVDEKRGVIEVTFKAKGNKADIKSYNNVGQIGGVNTDWLKNDTAVLRITCWFNNTQVKGTDYNTSPGEKVVFDPVNNDDNSFTWDNDRAHLRFEASDDANKFYTRLSTAAIDTVYRTYGDPVNADLWFYNFLSNPTVSDTSRAYLTLGIPWSDDDKTAPDPADCFVYMWDGEELTDVTKDFKYAEDAEEIPGWTTKTRVLGTYILSNKELNLDAELVVVEDAPAADDKDVPNTGR